MESIGEALKQYHVKIKPLSKEDALKFKQKMEAEAAQKYLVTKSKQFLKKRSLCYEKSLLNSRFKNLDYSNPDFREIATKVKQVATDYQNGQRYNVILQGKAGTGKSLLACCLLNSVHDNAKKPTNCLFLDATMFADLALSQNDHQEYDKQAHYSQVLRDLKETDVLVLDDLGSEASLKCGEITQANNTVQRALFNLGTIMQHKAVVITTNNSGAEIKQMYNAKVTSRLLTNNINHVFNFDNLPDYRQSHN